MDILFTWATQGLSWPDVGLFLMRLGVGLPFAISGYNKLTCPICKGYLRNNLKRSGIPDPGHCVSAWVAFWEFLAGITLILGLLTGLSAFILFIVCLVAFKVSWRRKLEKKNPVHFLDACTEVGFQFDLLLIWLVLGVGMIGPGRISFDYLVGVAVKRFHYTWATYDNGGTFTIEERSEDIANVHAKLHLQKIINPRDLIEFGLVRITY